jgi:hypothetical protein
MAMNAKGETRMDLSQSTNTPVRNPKYPDQTVENAARAAGANVQVMWQIDGPKDTAIKFMECLLINRTLVIVQTFDTGGWEVLTAGRSNRIDDTLIDVLTRCDVPAPAN